MKLIDFNFTGYMFYIYYLQQISEMFGNYPHFCYDGLYPSFTYILDQHNVKYYRVGSLFSEIRISNEDTSDQ